MERGWEGVRGGRWGGTLGASTEGSICAHWMRCAGSSSDMDRRSSRKVIVGQKESGPARFDSTKGIVLFRPYFYEARQTNEIDKQ